jgi:cellulose synthase (UDP-forming)
MNIEGTEQPVLVPHSPHRAGLFDQIAGGIALILGIAIIMAIATVPLSARQQAAFGIASALIFVVANRFKSRRVTLFLVALSLAVSSRYLYWRMTETLSFESPLEYLLGSGLVLAEIYAVVTLVLGYFQTVWPLERKPVPLPADPAAWPTVDLFIPTYNEELSIVRATVLGALAIDWPKDKLNIFILDDGRREQFRQFAELTGVGYLTRPDNAHAKAGNLNSALSKTKADYVAIFDCDHIPTRAFLQMTMGFMVADDNVALVQTPHHFYSPDPFQRNLEAGTRVPAEGNMFYGLIQDGNDYWNATFFCGSCAVLRRSALEQIGGFATETVTEDAHTMLKLHRLGWDSAYLRYPLAAGLATERLGLHIGQRMRWARGMIQILRIDTPFLGKGLSLGQRICYTQAMGHFLFALPRVVFLTAPLAFLLGGQNIISASPLAITAYALPHMLHSVATNARIQGVWRHSFWSEVYETVLALFLVRVNITTLISPRRGKFNVTAKGGLLENGFFDISSVYPNLILVFLIIAGVMRGLISLLFFQNDTLVFQALVLNTIWATLALLIVMAALAVGRETRQIRSRARLTATEQVILHLPDGRLISGVTRDLSQGGGSVMVQRPEGVLDGTDMSVEFRVGDHPVFVPARLLRWDRQVLQVRWQPKTIEEEARVIQAVFTRADAWTDWSAYPEDKPLASLWRVLISIRGLFRPRDQRPAPAPTQGGGGTPRRGGRIAPQAATAPGAASAARSIGGSTLILLISLLLPTGSLAQPVPNTVVRPVAQAPQLPPVGAAPAPAAAVPADATAAPAAPAASDAGALPANVRRVVLTLRQLGAKGPLALRGTSALSGVEFGIRADEVVTDAQLNIVGAMSPSLIPEFSNVTVTLNEEYVGTIPVNKDQANFTLQMPVSPVFFQDLNRLNFRFTGRYTPDCNDPLSGLLWSTIYDSSTLTLTLERLPAQRDLSRLPLPFFDSREKQQLTLPFVMSNAAGDAALRAAGITAAWFGVEASFRGAHFPVQGDVPQQGNAVMVVVAGDGNAPDWLPKISGPTLGVVANPNDPLGSILLIAGRNGDEVVAAAQTLVLGNRALGSDVAVVQSPKMPERSPYDAPNWIDTNHPVKLGTLVDAADLQVFGYTGLLHVPFRTAPDFYTWRNEGFPMDVKFRAPPGPIVDLAPSRLDFGINGIYLNTASLGLAQGSSWLLQTLGMGSARGEAKVTVPAYDVFGFNDLQFYFDAQPLHRGDCVAIPTDLRMSVDPDSTIDLSKGYRFAVMPNLQFFVNSGFPFTRMADLSDTAVVLPERPSAQEIGVYLDMMGRIASLSGYPPVKMALVRSSETARVGDRDLLIIGTIGHLQGAADLLAHGPLGIAGSRLSVAFPERLESVRRLFVGEENADRARAAAALDANATDPVAALVGFESPYASHRSVVALLGGTGDTLETSVGTLRDPDSSALVQGDLSILTTGKVTSYKVGDIYTVGSLPFWLWPSYVLRDQAYLVVVLTLIGAVFCGMALYWLMRRRGQTRLTPGQPPAPHA